VVTWLPFDLHPEYPPDGLPREQLLARYGSGMTENVRAFFAARGLEYRPHPAVVPRSLTALRLGELAREHGLHAPFHDAVMEAYWQDSLDIGDRAVLRRLAEAAGLPPDDVDDVLGTDRFADTVDAFTRHAVAIGATGVPAFLLAGRLLVLGAQPEQAFEAALARLRPRAGDAVD
jgi:predicted DsbA family dithiol-disulfide isomerase